MKTTTVSAKGRIVLPAELRRQDRIRAGQRFLVERIGAGEYRLLRIAARPNEGLVDLLLACPAKDWFGRGERGEAKDEVDGPSLG